MTDVAKALRQAFNLGQTYWQQADSESRSQWRKSDETRAKFDALVIETLAELEATRATPAPGAPAGFKLMPIEATPEMITAGGQTPGIRAIDGASAMHQLRGNPLPAEAFATGSPLAQAWRAMLDAAPGAPGQEAAAVQAVGSWPAELPLRLQVSYSPGDWDTFVYGVSGHLSMEVLTNIEAAIRGEDSEALFDLGPGDYLLSASYFAGQYGPEGRCEWAPCWEFDIEGFRPPAALPPSGAVDISPALESEDSLISGSMSRAAPQDV